MDFFVCNAFNYYNKKTFVFGRVLQSGTRVTRSLSVEWSKEVRGLTFYSILPGSTLRELSLRLKGVVRKLTLEEQALSRILLLSKYCIGAQCWEGITFGRVTAAF